MAILVDRVTRPDWSGHSTTQETSPRCCGEDTPCVPAYGEGTDTSGRELVLDV